MRQLLPAAAFFIATSVAVGHSAPVLVLASIYAPGDGVVPPRHFETSSGRRYNPQALTCAHKTLPFGTRLLLYHGRNIAEIIVTDRGPYRGGRVLDCTPAVDRALHLGGLGRVKVEPYPPLPRERPGDLR